MTGYMTYKALQHAEAWNAYIEQDDFLLENCGLYVERRPVFLPIVWGVDLEVHQDMFANIVDRRHEFQFGVDILKLNNMLNS